MVENRSYDLLDYLVIIAKWKKLFITLLIIIPIISYLSIYFFIPAQYDSRALIVTTDGEQSGGIASLMRSFSNLPVNIPGLKSGTDTDLFTTIIYSRTNLEEIIRKFGLYEEYGYNTMDETIKELTATLKADETKEGAYEIIMRDKSPQKAADIVNLIVDRLNQTLIELNVSKSRDNRLFLEKRYEDIKDNLKLAEDSLVFYQQKSGIFYAEEQARSSFEAYAKLEAELATRQIENSIMVKLYGEDSPFVESSKISVKEYEKKLNEIKSGKDKTNIILAIKNLPQSAMNYLRHFRDVEIYNKMLTFIIPLYEQARFDEQKNIPVLKIIDKAIPAEKKAFPQRTILTIIFTLIIILIVFVLILVRERIYSSTNPKILFLRKNISFKKISS
ncbi:MAG: Wzz/FepE/Etk N-terminal domain-containing protein [Melioribacteraceae bacterium]|nr:Wzz/FepE/Etk N-terminal domain-containing protein [Melioribacteraceae bacterium]